MQGQPMRLAVASLVPSVSNPRTYFDTSAMAELVASVSLKGVIQPIIVRPNFDESLYEIIAGERRWRAAKEAHGDDFQIDCIVHAGLSDSDALELSIIENSQRKDISVTEEADAAAKLLGRLSGNRDETAKRLGWSLSKLEKRLALMAAIESVRHALTIGEIQLGHAELIATLAPERQVKALKQVTEQKVSIEQLRVALQQYALLLNAAIFDKTECGNCQHNSSIQRTLFSTTLSEGSCSNAPCYEAKTEAKLQTVKTELEAENAVVRIIRPGEQFIALKLISDGPTGVGTEQASACRACKDYGATVSALPGSLGSVLLEQCMDSSCNSKMVAAKLKSERAAVVKANPVTQALANTTSTTKPATAAKVATATVTIDSSKLRTALKDYRDKMWRNALARHINADWSRSCEALVALVASGQISSFTSDSSATFAKAFNKLTQTNAATGQRTSNLGSVVSALRAAQAPETLQEIVQRIAPSAISSIEIAAVKSLLAAFAVNLADYWKVNDAFLEILVKGELQVVADEIGLTHAVGKDGMKKIFNLNKSGIIAKLLAVDAFNYAVIPSFLSY